MKTLHLIAILFLAVSWSCFPRLAEEYNSSSSQERRVHRASISRETTKFEMHNPDVGTIMIERHPLSVKGDSIIMSPGLLLFGDDPEIRVILWNSNYPNPFCPRSSIDFINLVPDTLVLAISREDVIPDTQMYRGLIDNGRFMVRINLNENLPAGPYMIELSVGNKKERIKKIFLK